MRVKILKREFLVPALLAACLMAWALPAAAEPDATKSLALRLYGGYSHMAAGDINEGCDGYFELAEIYGAIGGGTIEGGYNPVHGGYNFGADLVFQLSPWIGIGVGVGYMRSSSDSLMTLTEDPDVLTLSATPTISAMPIRLGVFFTVPVADKISLTADLGAAWYAGLKLEASQRLEFAADDWEEGALSASRSDLANLGFQGSLGFEYRLSPMIGLFVEAVGRYARFKNFESVTGTSRDSDGGSGTTEGKIYLLTYTYPEGTYSRFIISEPPPVDDPPEIVVTEPKIDLSGFSLQAGFRVRF